jgi:hypothetical protein
MMLVERGICRSGWKLMVPEAGSAIEEIQNCHIGNYMEGYLTHRNVFYCVSIAAAIPRCCFFALNRK